MTEKAQAKERKDGRENAVIHPLTIGSVNLANNLILGPMAGVSDLPFRLLCHEQGAGLVCTEMVSAKAIAYKNRNTRELLKVSDEERPVSLQIFGSDPVIMAEQARQIEDLHWDILDINMGCPVPKVFNNGDGSALLRNPLLAGQIIEAVAGAIHKPLTVKIRLGVSPDTINAVEMAHIAQESGAAGGPEISSIWGRLIGSRSQESSKQSLSRSLETAISRVRPMCRPCMSKPEWTLT